MGGKLLLADDSITIQKVVELVLSEEGFEIKAANNGEEALAQVETFRPDIVLADIEMPKMNGYQLCERLKTDPSTRDIPVILLAGAFEPIDEELARNVGAEDYITKPFESQELISKINAVMMAKEMASEEASTGTGALEAVEAFEAGAEGEELWTVEELTSEQLVSEEMAEETPLEALEEKITEEVPGIMEGPGEFIEEVISEEAVITAEKPEEKLTMPKIGLPSREEIIEALRAEMKESLAPLTSEMKDSFIATIFPYIKDSAEKVLWEVVPDLVERLLKEMVQGALSSLTKEVEKVIWETVPDLAESLIKREIEKIRSET